MQDKFWFDITNWRDYDRIKTSGDNLSANVPYILDLQVPAIEVDKNSLWFIPTTEFFCPGSVPVPYNTYQQCFCAVVTESNYAHPLPTFSEKTVNAIKAKVPFVLVSSAGTLEYLKKLGFMTFDKFWDESYDRELNHELRLQKIIKLIDYIDSWDLDKMNSLRYQMKDILDYNYRLLLTFRQPCQP
jgi:hypothetical protein